MSETSFNKLYPTSWHWQHPNQIFLYKRWVASDNRVGMTFYTIRSMSHHTRHLFDFQQHLNMRNFSLDNQTLWHWYTIRSLVRWSRKFSFFTEIGIDSNWVKLGRLEQTWRFCGFRNFRIIGLLYTVYCEWFESYSIPINITHYALRICKQIEERQNSDSQRLSNIICVYCSN